jgi:hypothetical protein
MAGLYQQPIPLNREQHGGLRLKPNGSDYRFAGGISVVPLAPSEFALAAHTYPIFFVQDPKREYLPVALLGFRDAENRFLDAEGRWQAPYVPAAVRRYPFILTEDGNVCIDAGYAGFGAEGDPLFDEKGRETPLLQRHVAFLARFQQEMAAVKEFCRRLSENRLLQAWGVHVVREGGQQLALDGLFTIDAKQLAALEDAPICSLFRSGDLALIHAQMLSLHNIGALSARSPARG